MIWNHDLKSFFELWFWYEIILWQVILISNQFSGDFCLFYLIKKSKSLYDKFGHSQGCFHEIGYNTSLTSSAAVEGLFSSAGLIASSRRHRLSDRTFEKLLMLTANQYEWLRRLTDKEHISLQFWMLCVILIFDLENHSQNDFDLKSFGNKWFWFWFHFFFKDDFTQHCLRDEKEIAKWNNRKSRDDEVGWVRPNNNCSDVIRHKHIRGNCQSVL